MSMETDVQIESAPKTGRQRELVNGNGAQAKALNMGTTVGGNLAVTIEDGFGILVGVLNPQRTQFGNEEWQWFL
jgi:hypothetical protein